MRVARVQRLLCRFTDVLWRIKVGFADLQMNYMFTLSFERLCLH